MNIDSLEKRVARLERGFNVVDELGVVLAVLARVHAATEGEPQPASEFDGEIARLQAIENLPPDAPNLVRIAWEALRQNHERLKGATP